MKINYSIPFSDEFKARIENIKIIDKKLSGKITSEDISGWGDSLTTSILMSSIIIDMTDTLSFWITKDWWEYLVSTGNGQLYFSAYHDSVHKKVNENNIESKISLKWIYNGVKIFLEASLRELNAEEYKQYKKALDELSDNIDLLYYARNSAAHNRYLNMSKTKYKTFDDLLSRVNEINDGFVLFLKRFASGAISDVA